MNFEKNRTNKDKIETENVESKEVEEVTVDDRISDAQDPSTSKETLEVLSKDANDRVRESAVDPQNTPPEMLTELSSD